MIFCKILWLRFATENFFKLFTHIVVEKFRKTFMLFVLQYTKLVMLKACPTF